MIHRVRGAAAFDGEDPETDADREALLGALRYAMTVSKKMAKQKFTPKKYRKGSEPISQASDGKKSK